MDKPMDEIKVGFTIKGQQGKEADKPHRLFSEGNESHPICRDQPKVQDFIGCPDYTAGYAAPENIVQNLISEKEFSAFFHPADVKFPIGSVDFFCNEKKMKSTEDDP